MSAVPHY